VPPPLIRRGAAAARGRALHSGAHGTELVGEVRRRGAVRAAELAALGLRTSGDEDVRREGEWLIDPERWASWAAALVAHVDAHAVASPLEPGCTTAAACQALGLPDPRLLAPLATEAGIDQHAGRLRRAERSLELGPAEEPVRRLEKRLRADPFAAPDRGELRDLRLGPRELAAAERCGRLLRVSRDVVLLPEAPGRALSLLRSLPQPFTLGAARTALGTSRRVALPLLEHLDRSGWTRRLDGELREVRQP